MNQIGSVTESIEAVRMSKQAGWGVMASHRRYLFCFVTLYYSLYVHTNVIHLVYCSGETEDTFIAELSVGLATVSCQNPKLFFFFNHIMFFFIVPVVHFGTNFV